MMSQRLAGRAGTLKRIGVGIVFLWFFVGGLAHFLATRLEMSIVPPALPSPRALVLISGAFELLGALGVLFSATRRAAGIGLFALTIAVTPANLYMLQHAERFHISYGLLVARLPLQLVLLAIIAWSTIQWSFSTTETTA